MDSQEFKYEKDLAYDDQIKYLQNKYGLSKENYFVKDTCKSRNKKISRTNEGLIIHHVKENEQGAFMLSDPICAKKFPFEYQMPNNLVYCNYLEHLLLHLKIENTLHNPEKKVQMEREKHLIARHSAYVMWSFIPWHGFGFIMYNCNRIYSGDSYIIPWETECANVISNNFEDYTDLLSEVVQNAINHFDGKKDYISPKRKVGDEWHNKFGKKLKVIKIEPSLASSDGNDILFIQIDDQEPKSIMREQFEKGTYQEEVTKIIKYISLDIDNNISSRVFESVNSKVSR